MTSISTSIRRLPRKAILPVASSSTSPLSSLRTITTTSSSPQLTLALLKPTTLAYPPDTTSILHTIKSSSLTIVRTRRLHWTPPLAHAFYAEHAGRFYYDRLILGMLSGPSLALALYGDDAIARWRQMLGPTKAYMGKWENPHCLRAKYGLGDTRNGFHGSDSTQSARRELGLLFEGWDIDWWLDREQGRLPVDQEGRMNPLGF